MKYVLVQWTATTDTGALDATSLSVIQLSRTNLIKILRHVEVVTGDNGYKDRMWYQLSDLLEMSNDTIVHWCFPDESDVEFCGEQYVKDCRVLQQIFDIEDEDGITVEISW